MAVLVIADHKNTSLRPVTLNVANAAKQLSNDVHVLVIGYNYKKAIQEASQIDGVTKVLAIDDIALEHDFAENAAPIIKEIAKEYSHILAANTTFGKNLLPRIAALLDMQAISDVNAIIDDKTFERPVYNGKAIATIKSRDKIKCLTLRAINFKPALIDNKNSAPIEVLKIQIQNKAPIFIKTEKPNNTRPDLTTSKIVLAGGRAIGSKENFLLLEKLADKIGAAVGATKTAVDAGYATNEMQIGQTGKVIAPDLYIGIGISGAPQHISGIKDSKIIVVINKDENAPIFKIADYALIADFFEIFPELEAKL